MDEPRECHTEWSKSDREGEIYGISYMWNPKWYQWMDLQNRKRLMDLENELMVARGRDSKGVWESHVHTAIFQMQNQQGLSV